MAIGHLKMMELFSYAKGSHTYNNWNTLDVGFNLVVYFTTRLFGAAKGRWFCSGISNRSRTSRNRKQISMRKLIIKAKWKRFWSCGVRMHKMVNFYRQNVLIIFKKEIPLIKKHDFIGCNTCGKTFYNIQDEKRG